MASHKHGIILAGVLAFAFPIITHAQEAAAAANAARNTRDTISALNRLESPSPSQEFAMSSPGDADLGDQVILTETDLYKPLTFGAGYSTTWTSNAFYTPSNASSDVVMGAYLEGLYLPHLGNNFFLEGAAAIRGFRYFRNPILDFNAVEVSAGLLKIIPELWGIGVYGRYQYDMLWYPGGGEILHEHTLVAGVRKGVTLSRAQTLFFSLEADFSLGGFPDFAMAHEFSFFASHQVEWTRYLYSSLYYQMAVYDFRYDNRADLRNTLGLLAGVQPFPWLNLSATTWLGWNASNDSFYDFFVVNAGGAVTATINF